MQAGGRGPAAGLSQFGAFAFGLIVVPGLGLAVLVLAAVLVSCFSSLLQFSSLIFVGLAFGLPPSCSFPVKIPPAVSSSRGWRSCFPYGFSGAILGGAFSLLSPCFLVTRDRLLREWVLEETAENMHRNFGSGYPGDPETKAWLDHHKHLVFGFPTLVRFSWGTCAPYLKDGVEVIWESDEVDENSSNNGRSKRQVKLSKLGFSGCKRRTEDIESNGKGRSKFFQARKLELVPHFQ
ncbi:hypothetical protein M5K25_006899 [Dendrobium thyrsiflorum]|uniref:Ribonuclease H2 subunit A n=1 Tax=Dendrobium thyrsiflorum TaxID=117978 RepID=A0ABD0VCS7_DENTH